MVKKTRKVTLELPETAEGEITEERQSAAERAAEYSRETAGMEEDDAQEFFAGLDELRATRGVIFQVFRTEPPERAGFCSEYAANIFSLQRVTKDYGAGTYRVRVKSDGRYIPGGGTFKIAESVPVDPTEPTTLTDLITRLEERQAAQQASRQARFDKLTELAIPGLLSIIAAVMGRNTSPDMTALIAALKPAPGPSLNDLTGALANLKTLQGEDRGGALDGLEKLFKGLELMKDFASEGKSSAESNWIDVLRDVVKEVVPAARPMLENLQAQALARAEAQRDASKLSLPMPTVIPSSAAAPASMPPPPAAPVHIPSAPVHIPVAPVHPVSVQFPDTLPEGADMWTVAEPLIRAQVEKLMRWATEGKRPDLYAELFVDELPQIVAKYLPPEQALTLLQRADWWEHVKRHYPELEPHYAWLDRFRGELVLLVEEIISEEHERGNDAT